MLFTGITRDFSLRGEEQYITIGAFWDEMSALYGMENLRGLGYKWEDQTISYAIGLKDGAIDGHNLEIELPCDGWSVVDGRTDDLKAIYDDIYKGGRLKLEIETFNDDGSCRIEYYR